MNGALAVIVATVLKKQMPVKESDLCKGLADVYWPGRLQLIQKPNGQKILLDGAHNVAGAEALRASLEQNFGGMKPALIFGALADKDWPDICQRLAPLAEKFFTVPVASERTADPVAVAKVFRAASPKSVVASFQNLSAVLSACQDEPFLVITGSLYLIGEALEQLGYSPAEGGERGLNEWRGPQTRK